jgi:hypothetical protein
MSNELAVESGCPGPSPSDKAPQRSRSIQTDRPRNAKDGKVGVQVCLALCSARLKTRTAWIRLAAMAQIEAYATF